MCSGKTHTKKTNAKRGTSDVIKMESLVQLVEVLSFQAASWSNDIQPGN